MIRVLFICHGNICRSPMAMMILANKVNELGLKSEFVIDSKAVSSEELGNNIYPPAMKVLKLHNIPLLNHHASRFEPYQYDLYDYIIAMDRSNINRLNLIAQDTKNKYRLLSSFMRLDKEVDDPWYTRDFESCYEEIDTYLNGFIAYLKRYKKIKLID